MKKQLLVVGDRVLVTPEEGEEHRTRVGLYLPPTAIDSQAVQSGLIVATGPGTPIPDMASLDDEPWKVTARAGEPRHRPMQAKVGDHALFFRKAAVEITFEDRRYLVVPEAAILVLVREELPI
ncbi:MAG: co-chaperone GroES [Gemmatimonadota bacterium]